MSTGDNFTILENRLDREYAQRLEQLGHAQNTPDFNDVIYRQAYLQCIRDMHEWIADARNPEKPTETGEIPDILQQAQEEHERVNNA